MIWVRVTITFLTVAAFVVTGFGAVRVWLDARAAVRRLEREREAVRDAYANLARSQQQARENREELLAAHAKFVDELGALGVKPRTRADVNLGAEPIAERTIRDIENATRTDLKIVGAGLLLGLAASVWDVWAN